MKHVRGKNLSKPKRASPQEDRAWGKAFARVEELGRSLCKPLPKSDATVAKVVALVVGTMAIQEKLVPPGTVPFVRQDSNKYLRVPDAESWAAFRKQAEMVYRKAHSHKSERGRPSEETAAFMSLLKLSPEEEGMPTYGETVKALMELKLSKNTVYKYAKLYHLSLRWTHDQTQLTHAERKWFAKNKGTDSWSRLFWMSRYLHEKRRLEEMGGSELF